MKELLKNLEEISMKCLILGFVMFLAVLGLKSFEPMAAFGITGEGIIALLLFVFFVEDWEEWKATDNTTRWRYFYLCLVGLVLLTFVIGAMDNYLLAKLGIVIKNPFVQICLPMYLTTLFLSPLVLLLWQDEEVKTTWYVKLLGIILSWIAFALFCGLYIAM